MCRFLVHFVVYIYWLVYFVLWVVAWIILAVWQRCRVFWYILYLLVCYNPSTIWPIVSICCLHILHLSVHVLGSLMLIVWSCMVTMNHHHESCSVSPHILPFRCRVFDVFWLMCCWARRCITFSCAFFWFVLLLFSPLWLEKQICGPEVTVCMIVLRRLQISLDFLCL